jgi:hypothetical protein
MAVPVEVCAFVCHGAAERSYKIVMLSFRQYGAYRHDWTGPKVRVALKLGHCLQYCCSCNRFELQKILMWPPSFSGVPRSSTETGRLQ